MKQDMEDSSAKHPYSDYENNLLWDVIDKSLSKLEENRDIKISTAREYVIGYICKQIEDRLETNPFRDRFKTK